MPLHDVLTLIIGAVGVGVAATSAVKALIEYRLQGAAKRSEVFLQMRSRLRSDASFSKICGMLEADSPQLAEVSLIERDRFIGFFEELAILKNSGLLKKTLVFYMFGYFAIRCNESTQFWAGLNRKQQLWSLFMDFAKEMKETEKTFVFNKRRFKL